MCMYHIVLIEGLQSLSELCFAESVRVKLLSVLFSVFKWMFQMMLQAPAEVIMLTETIIFCEGYGIQAGS